MFKWLFSKKEKVTKVIPPKRWFTLKEIEDALAKIDILKDDAIERKIREETKKNEIAKVISDDKAIVEPSDNIINITECELVKVIDEVISGYAMFFDSSVEHACFKSNLSSDIISKINK